MKDNEPQQQLEEKLKQLIHSWGLSRFSEGMAWQWLRRMFQTQQHDLERLTKWILMQLNHQKPSQFAASPWQRGCPEIIPLLRAEPVWNPQIFPYIQTLEASFDIIKEELLALKHQQHGFQPYRAPTWVSDINAKDGLGSMGHDAGDWNVFYLFLHNMDFKANRALCPRTVEIIESIADHYDHAFFSALAPQTHIKKHHGPTNKKLRIHLPLIVPPNKCRLRVSDEIICVQEGKCFVFDDSFEHEAWNDDPSHSRIVLIIDVWHPDLTPVERKFFSFLRNAQLRMDKKHSAAQEDNFYSIIEKAHQQTQSSSTKEAIWS